MTGFSSTDIVSIGSVNIRSQTFGEAASQSGNVFVQEPADGILRLGFMKISSDYVIPCLDNMIKQRKFKNKNKSKFSIIIDISSRAIKN